MFAGFNLKITEKFFNGNIDKYAEIAKKDASNLCSDDDIKNYVITKFIDDGSLNGQKILDHWFPTLNCDVFISHAHSDTNLANAFSGWLKQNFGISAFVDSNVWNYIDTLLYMLNEHSDKRPHGTNGWIYDYNKCNQAAQHANIMLLMSLQKMIDNVEAVFFLNTDNSVKAINPNGICSTYSPWIYAELLCADLIRKKPLKEYRNKYILEHSEIFTATDLLISYNISPQSLKDINENDLKNWKEEYNDRQNTIPLDLLYKMFVNEVSNVKND